MLQYSALTYIASNGLVTNLSVWAVLKMLTAVRLGGGEPSWVPDVTCRALW